MTVHDRAHQRTWSEPLFRGLSLLIAFVLAAASIVGIAQAAHATPGITATLLLNGSETYNGVPVVDEGDTLTLRVQYSQAVGAGTEVEFVLGASVTIGAPPAANEMIESFTPTANGVIVKFRDPLPDTNQGFFDLKMTVNAVTESTIEDITWTIDGQDESVEVIIRNTGDQFENVTQSYSKSADRGNFDSFVSVDNLTRVVTVDPSIENQIVTYTLRVGSPDERTNFVITDQLHGGMSYVGVAEGVLSTTTTLTTWDDDGLNRETNPFTFEPSVTGNAFSGTVNLGDGEAPSTLEITYQARVTDYLALQSALQALLDAAPTTYGNFDLTLSNTATFGDPGTSRSADIRVRASAQNPNPGPNLDNAFAKTADWSTQNVETEEDGTLLEPLAITYTLRANLTPWNGGGGESVPNPNRTLTRNVVISDVLPSQANWLSTDPDFITMSGTVATFAGPLTQAADDPCPSADAFADNAYVGMWCVTGNTLLINIGHEGPVPAPTTDVTFEVKAQLNTVAGLTEAGDTSVAGATPHRLRNTATFYYNAGGGHDVRRDVTVVRLPDTGPGIDDSSVFVKVGEPLTARVNPGDSVVVDYTFTVKAGTGVDVRTARIIDHIDPSIFDVSDPATVSVTGSYDGGALANADFVTSLDDEGNLVIELSEDRKALIADPGDKELRVKITLTSRAFVGKETITISNSATLEADTVEFDYISSHSFEATSFGDEAEVRKRLFDPRGAEGSEWTDVLKAYVDANGVLIQDTYAYRVEFIGHGTFGSVAIIPVVDELSDALTFLGFVDAADAADPLAPGVIVDPTGPKDIGANLRATYDPVEHEVIISQVPSTTFSPGDRTAVYFLVQVTDPSDVEAPIVNRIGSTQASIEPQEGPSIDIEKWTLEPGDESGPSYDENGVLQNDGYLGDWDEALGKELPVGEAQQILFTISNDGGEPLRDVVVSDRLTGGTGTITGLVCIFPDDSEGTTWAGVFEPGAQFSCTGTLPKLPPGAIHSDTATVTAVGVFSGDEVDDEDEWHGYTKAMAATGGSIQAGVVWAAMLLVAAGGALLLVRRIRSGRHTGPATHVAG